MAMPFTIEFLNDEQSFQPHHAPYLKNLATLGIDATFRLVDAVQYRARVEDFDFDMTRSSASPMSATPGDSMRTFFSSQAAAKTKGSYNLAGIADPVIDALIDKIIAARDERNELTDRLPCLRPRVPRRALLGAAMVCDLRIHIAYWDVFAIPRQAARNGCGYSSASVRPRTCGGSTRPRPQIKLEQAK